ncbi:MAG: hypothetical protein KA746_06990 [Pyrinomonadaceae bacterium]|nr:hypothetical protein [Pyrinomonadaceae bacterium]
MNKNLQLAFNGFLSLPNLDKMKMVELINEYFDSNDKESIRAAHDLTFSELSLSGDAGERCVCCGK